MFYDANGNEVRPLVSDQLFLHLGGSLVLWERLRVAANLPIAAVVDGNSGTAGATQFSTSNGASIGDLRLSADVRLFGTYGSLVTGAVGLSAWLPTGSQSSFTGDGKVRLAPHFSVAGEAGSFAYAARVGFNYHAENGSFAGQSIGNEVFWGASAGVRLVEQKLLVGPELYGSTVVQGGDVFSQRGSPMEVVLGGHYTAPNAVPLRARRGPGPDGGLRHAEAARPRVDLEWAPGIEKPKPPPPPPPSDRDGDGILDDDDACPDKKLAVHRATIRRRTAVRVTSRATA